ncbi:MAG: hypothetical protein KBF28_11160 [Gemmatimonadales bacterium]|nr:hypothetical protein [Gemmatimonadales bacterium]
MSKSTHTAPLTIDSTLIRGRLHLTATYASSRANVPPHTTEGRDDGTVIGCTCPGYQTYNRGHCRHTDSLALDYFRWKWHGAPLARLVECDRNLRHWLSLGPDAADEAAARIELTVIGDYIGERTADQAAA